ncbi:MAG TPA: hypothetical protein PKV72_01625 [Candidatus Peribacteria bacterium]|nr:hypothetical protein [Candidatus Peribacteria bacterium]
MKHSLLPFVTGLALAATIWVGADVRRAELSAMHITIARLPAPPCVPGLWGCKPKIKNPPCVPGMVGCEVRNSPHR